MNNLDIETYKTVGNSHPSPAQTIVRLAIEKALDNKQRKIWAYWNYDRLTQKEIAKRMRLKSASNVAHRIKTIEGKIKRFCASHKAIYETLTGV